MLEINPKYKNIVEFVMKYQTDQYKVLEHLFNKLKLEVLDYHIIIKNENEILVESIDLVPYDFDNTFLEVIKELDKLDEDLKEEWDGYYFELKFLCVIGLDSGGDVICDTDWL